MSSKTNHVIKAIDLSFKHLIKTITSMSLVFTHSPNVLHMNNFAKTASLPISALILFLSQRCLKNFSSPSGINTVEVSDFVRFFRGGVCATNEVQLASNDPPEVQGHHSGEDHEHGGHVEGYEDGGLKGEGPKGRDGDDGGGKEGRDVASARQQN